MTEVEADIIYYCESGSIELRNEVIKAPLLLHCVTSFQEMKEKIVECVKDSNNDLNDHIDKILEDYKNEDKYCIVYFRRRYRETQKEYLSKDIPPLTGYNDLSGYIENERLNGKLLIYNLTEMQATILYVKPNVTNTKLFWMDVDSYKRTLWCKSNLEEVKDYIQRVLPEEADEFERSIVTHYQEDLSDQNFCVVYYHKAYRESPEGRKIAFDFCNADSEFIKADGLDSSALLEYLKKITHTIIYIHENPLTGSQLFLSVGKVCRLVRKTGPEEVSKYVKEKLKLPTEPRSDATVHIHRLGTTSLRSWQSISEFLTINIGKLLDHLFPLEEIWLIVGRTDNLEKELVEDIRQTCKKAGMDDQRIEQILQKSLYTDTENCTEIEETSGKCYLRIIVSPTVEEFERFMIDAIKNCCARSLTIVYCGHGTECGSIYLFDDIYSGIELKELLQNNKFFYSPEIRFYFNCCYATNIVSKITGIDALQVLLKLAGFILDVPNDSDIQNVGFQTVLKSYYGDQNENKKLFAQWKDKLSRSFFQLKNIFLVPLSVGVLKAQGLLYIALKQELAAESVETPEIKTRMPPPYNKEDWRFLRENCPPDTHVQNPTVTVFQAGRGDSALFSWGKWNVLIDGGIEKHPCFLSKIRTLPRLDLVVLTHGDADHINGLQTFFERLSDGECGRFVERAAYLFPEKIPNRGWSQVIKLDDTITKANIRNQADLTQEYVIGSNRELVIKFIHPPQGKIKKTALEELQKELKKEEAVRGGLTLINRSSLVVCIECCNKSFLFTGDADGTDVIQALKDNKLDQKIFSYVDMPHHGSINNHPKEFLEKIKTENIIVSTNGAIFKHPDVDTVEELREYMEKNSDCHLYFNYKKRYENYREKLSRVERRVHCPQKDDGSGIQIEIPIPIF